MARVLVVDDSEEISRMVGLYLKDAGHEVTEARDALNISELVTGFKPELIILDYNMPQVNGAQAMGRIRTTPGGERIPIIFLSGQPGYRLKVAVDSSATERFLHKPVELSQLRSLADAMLGVPPKP